MPDFAPDGAPDVALGSLAGAAAVGVAVVTEDVLPPIAPWHRGQVTVLGGAIHVMRLAGGADANTARRDASSAAGTIRPYG